MAQLGREAIAPGPRTSTRTPDQVVYPYLLRGLTIDRRDPLWSTDITSLPLEQSFMDLTAVIDWYSHYVLFRRLSNTIDGRFCLVVLKRS